MAATQDPLKTGWSYLILAAAQQGGGTQYPSDGVGGLAAGASAADRLAASLLATAPARMLFGGVMVTTTVTVGPINIALRNLADTLTIPGMSWTFPVLTVPGAPDSSNYDNRPWKLVGETGILIPGGFGVIATGTAAAAAVAVLYKILT